MRLISSVPNASDGMGVNLLVMPILFAVFINISSPRKRCVFTAYILSEYDIAAAIDMGPSAY